VTIVTTDSANARAELTADYTPHFIRAEHHVSPEVVLHALTILVRAGYLRHIESKPHQVIWGGRDHGTAGAEAPHPAGGLVLAAS